MTTNLRFQKVFLLSQSNFTLRIVTFIFYYLREIIDQVTSDIGKICNAQGTFTGFPEGKGEI